MAGNVVQPPSDSQPGGEEFSNNLFTDLAPILTLFGEQVTKQFLSQSMGWGDDILLAMVPLGILTCVVSAIRIGGRKWLKALVGRARESKATVELELLSSTSDAVCELWSGDEIVRERGNPYTKEFIYRRLDKHERDTTASDIVYDLETAYRRGVLVPKQGRMQSPNLTIGKVAELTAQAPNLTLNVTKAVSSRTETWVFASFGVLIQLAVWTSSGLATYHWRFYSGRAIESYGYPLFLSGSVLLSVGIILCSYIIESSTDELDFEPASSSDALKIIRIQRACTVGEQHYGSFVIENNERDSTIRTSRINLERNFSALALIAASLSIGGYIIQFIGLRALHWSTAVAVLGATFIMTGVRSYVRKGLSAVPNPKPIDLRECEDQELSWIALDAAQLKGWEILHGRYGGSSPEASICDPVAINVGDDSKSYLTTKVVEVREETERLVSWNSNTAVLAAQLADAIHATLQLFMEQEDDLTVDDNKLKAFIYKWFAITKLNNVRLLTENRNDPDEPPPSERSFSSSSYSYATSSTRSTSVVDVVESHDRPDRDPRSSDNIVEAVEVHHRSNREPVSTGHAPEVGNAGARTDGKPRSTSGSSEVAETDSQSENQALSTGDGPVSERSTDESPENGSNSFNLYLSEVISSKEFSKFQQGEDRKASHVWPTSDELRAALLKKQDSSSTGLTANVLMYGGKYFVLGLNFEWDCPILLQSSDENLSDAVKSTSKYRLHTQLTRDPFQDETFGRPTRLRKGGRMSARGLIQRSTTNKDDGGIAPWSLSVTTLTAILSLSIYTIQSKIGRKQPGSKYIRLIGDRENPLLKRQQSFKDTESSKGSSGYIEERWSRQRSRERRHRRRSSGRKVEEWDEGGGERVHLGDEADSILHGKSVPRDDDAMLANFTKSPGLGKQADDQGPQNYSETLQDQRLSPGSDEPRVNKALAFEDKGVTKGPQGEHGLLPDQSARGYGPNNGLWAPTEGEPSIPPGVDEDGPKVSGTEGAELEEEKDLKGDELGEEEIDPVPSQNLHSDEATPTVHAVWIERTTSALMVPFPAPDQLRTLDLDQMQTKVSAQQPGGFSKYPVFGYVVASASRTWRQTEISAEKPDTQNDDKRLPHPSTSVILNRSEVAPRDVTAESILAQNHDQPRRASMLSGPAESSHRGRFRRRESTFRQTKSQSTGDFCEAVATTQPLSLLCAQEIFSSFLLELTGLVRKVGGQTFKRSSPNSRAGEIIPRLDNTIFTKMADILVESNLVANQEEAYTLIIPPFHARVTGFSARILGRNNRYNGNMEIVQNIFPLVEPSIFAATIYMILGRTILAEKEEWKKNKMIMLSMKIINPAIPFDSVVVVIGANGYMGLETCEKLLQTGFRVRGTVRNIENHLWMIELFDKKWPGKFQLTKVEDFEAEGAFDVAFKDASGVIYVSTPVVFDADPAKSIDPIVKGTINTLQAAAQAGVKRYVLSSSSKGVESTVYNIPHTLTKESYNYEDLRKAREEPIVDTFERAVSVYSAGRAAAELAFWDWVKTNNPPFTANVVVPDGNFGRVLGVSHMNGNFTTSCAMLKNALAGEREGVFPYVGYLIDVQDSARLLVAAVALQSLSNERIFAYYLHYTWNDLRRRVREIYPHRTDIVQGEDYEDLGRDLGNADKLIQEAEQILRQVGQPGFHDLDSILRDFVGSCYPE